MVLGDGERPAALHIDNGVIARVVAYASRDPDGATVFDAADLVVSPGLVDTHVHVNEPGRTEWEGFDTATRAAAAGGVTTIVDMPLNSIPATTTVSALHEKREASRARCHVDVGYWGGVVPGNAAGLDGLVDAGVRGFKCFLVPSGVDEFPAVGEQDLREALPILARRRVPLLVHAESPAFIGSPAFPPSSARGEELPLQRAPGRSREAFPLQPSTYATYLATRPPEAELDAIRLMVRLAREFAAHVHIVHVSSAEGVEAIAAARTAGVPITAETCPHYLTFDAEEIPDGATEFKCAPPIRAEAHRDALWDGLGSGALDMIVTDHSPAPPSLKRPGGEGDFIKAWGGIASLELSLAATWTRLKPRAALTAEGSGLNALCLLARWMSAAPAALAGLGGRKGRLAAGFDADLVVWDPDDGFVVDPARLQCRHKLTPYAGRSLSGVVHTTLVRGERVWDRNRLVRAWGGQLL
jgi:allantoinase